MPLPNEDNTYIGLSFYLYLKQTVFILTLIVVYGKYSGLHYISGEVMETSYVY